jgi:cellulose synthase/poly-beta-1,6-N-acetylglucosamine synthase-like glycosyltransferase
MTPLPLVSVIVMCRNEKHSIAECLDSLIANDYPKDRLELFVSDGMSEDGTRAILESYATQHSFLKMIDNPKRIPASAANEGIHVSKGDLIMIAGAHAVYPKDYISKCVAYAKKYPDADNIGGVRHTEPRTNTLIGKSIAYVSSHRLGAGTAGYHRSGKNPRWVESVWGGCYRKDVFEKLGLFNDALVVGEDREFNQRLRESGGKILQVPEITCTYYSRSKIRDYSRWAFRMGFWPFYAERVSGKKLVSLRNFIPLAFVMALVLTLGLSSRISAGWYLVATLLSVYVLAGVVSAVTLAIGQKDLRYLVFVPVIFALTHIPYGVGSACGIVKRVPPSDSQLQNSESTLPV